MLDSLKNMFRKTVRDYILSLIITDLVNEAVEGGFTEAEVEGAVLKALEEFPETNESSGV